MMLVTKNDLLKLIDQSDNTISEKAEIEKVVNSSTKFAIEQNTEGVQIVAKEQRFILKGISMRQFYNNRL